MSVISEIAETAKGLPTDTLLEFILEVQKSGEASSGAKRDEWREAYRVLRGEYYQRLAKLRAKGEADDGWRQVGPFEREKE